MGRGTKPKDKCRVSHPDNPAWVCDRHKRHDGEHKAHPRGREVVWPGPGRAYDPENPYVPPHVKRRMAEGTWPPPSRCEGCARCFEETGGELTRCLKHRCEECVRCFDESGGDVTHCVHHKFEADKRRSAGRSDGV